MKKKISIVVPCYNEIENVGPLYEAVTAEMAQHLPQYDYEILFADNRSTDGTRDALRLICARDRRVRAILNQRNFGHFNSSYYALTQAAGDCAILLACDFQDPVELIPDFVAWWEAGYKVVIGKKTTSRENPVMYALRGAYYKLIRKMSEVDQIEHFTGFGLYDRSFVAVLRSLDDPRPYLRGIVAELGPERKEIEYDQPQRRAGKTHYSWYNLYDAAMVGLTSYTKSGLRIATIAGFLLAAVAVGVGIYYLVMKLLFWDEFPMGIVPIILLVLFFGAVQLFFIGLLGEYVMAINTRVMRRPLVIEEERLNFDEPAADSADGAQQPTPVEDA